MVARRSFISLVGGGTVMALGIGTLAGCASSFPIAAVQAWEPVDKNIEIRRWMLAHALLAPNPHNRQPWKADLRQADQITLICDGDRLLPETDPFGRQILIGCGAFIELAVMAAAQRGYRTDVEVFPAGEPALTELPINKSGGAGVVVARLKITADNTVKPDPLFAYIRNRHTNKGVFDNQRAISTENQKNLTAVAAPFNLRSGLVTETGHMQQLRAITRQAYEIEISTPRTHLESAKLFRIGPDEIEKNRDGISINGAMPRAMVALGMFDRMAVPARGDSNFKTMMDRWQPFETGSGYLWMATDGNSRGQQVSCGRAYVRTQLAATSMGLALHPLSQALQEFAEMKEQYQKIHQVLGFEASRNTVQMLVRVGYPATIGTGTPRRDLVTMIVI
jgi:hypothetical protein